MRRFAELYFAIDGSNKTSNKVAMLVQYLRDAPAADAAWAIYFLRGGKLRAPVPSRVLAVMAAESAGGNAARCSQRDLDRRATRLDRRRTAGSGAARPDLPDRSGNPLNFSSLGGPAAVESMGLRIWRAGRGCSVSVSTA